MLAIRQGPDSCLISTIQFSTSISIYFEIVLIIILIVLTGILSMAELAVVSTKKAKLEKLLNEGHKSAQIIIDFAEDPNQYQYTLK